MSGGGMVNNNDNDNDLFIILTGIHLKYTAFDMLHVDITQPRSTYQSV